MAREDYLPPAAHSVTAVNIDGVLSLNCTRVLDLSIISAAPPTQPCLLPTEL